MFVGHALLAFALVAGASALTGVSRNRATLLGVAAAGFATAPDVDMAYALVGVHRALVAAFGGGDPALISAFWGTGNLVHRAVTHSLVVAPVVALAAALWVHGRSGSTAASSRPGADAGGRTTGHATGGALLVAGGLVAVAAVESGLLGGVVMALFVLTSLAVAEAVARRSDASPTATFAVAVVAIASHPFGDLLTGEPPALLYPFDATLLAERVLLSADPTLHLLGAFAVELAAIWAGVAVYLYLAGVSPRVALARRATLGAGYAASVLVLPAPTLEVSYQFVFTVLAVGLVGLLPRVRLVAVDARRGPRLALPDGASAVVTGLAAVTVAWAAYTLAYVLV